ncbi:hypothetical protein MTR67_013848 [Solanum verrucosum]|uniref:F-box domain-containing protein n=1 Tax=Solanum verrucosum TaxID=315347 RepID=A0AAF0QDA9_SOLVR|nr:hypothetical protein MTR67_013848 [Solanum verrucosum]
MEGGDFPVRRWEDLDNDILVKILQFFDLFELSAGLAHVCNVWRLARCDQLLWETLNLSDVSEAKNEKMLETVDQNQVTGMKDMTALPFGSEELWQIALSTKLGGLFIFVVAPVSAQGRWGANTFGIRSTHVGYFDQSP